MRPANNQTSTGIHAEISRKSPDERSVMGWPVGWSIRCLPPARRSAGAPMPLLEAPVQMALIGKAAQVGHLGAGQAGLQVLLGAEDAVGQQVVVRGDAKGLLELPQQGVGVGLAHLGQIVQADLVLEMRSEVLDRPHGAMAA